MLFLCAILGTLITFIAYPGFFYTDSEARVSFAYNITNILRETFHGNIYKTSSWLTVVPQFFIWISILLTGNIALYTFIQAFTAFLAIALILKEISNYPKLMTMFVFLCPLFFCNGVFYEAGVGCLTGIIFLILNLIYSERLNNRLDIAIWVFLLCFWSFVCFGYRANAITILPALLLIIWHLSIKKSEKLLAIIAVIIGLLATILLPKLLRIDTMSSGTAGIAWEIVMSIKDMPKEEQIYYSNFLDDIGGDGSTIEAINSINYRNVCSLTSTRISPGALSKPGMDRLVINKYIELFMKQPKACIMTKLRICSYTLGVGEPLDHVAWIYNQYDGMGKYGFNDSSRRYLFYESYMKAVSYFKVCLIPWIWFLIDGIGIIIKHFVDRKQNKSFRFERWMYLLAVFYYLAYCIDTQAFELRYFYPSFILLLIVSLSLLENIIIIFKKVYKKSDI